jgi:hypothetical protein
MRRVVRWLGFNWLLRAECPVKVVKMPTTAECQPLKDDSSGWSMLVCVSVCLSCILSMSIFLNSRLHYHVPKCPVEEATNRNIIIKPTRAHESI